MLSLRVRAWRCSAKFLWLQEACKSGMLTVRKVSGRENPADIFTKPLSYGEMFARLGQVHVVAVSAV